MLPKPLIAILIVAALPFVVAPAVAQDETSPIAQPRTAAPPPRHVRSRITVHPRPLLYRRCVDWYELQHRPSGTVLFPEMRCWWVRG